MGLLIHDGRRGAHRTWATSAIRHGHADGIIISPFCTPRVHAPRYPSGQELTEAVAQVTVGTSGAPPLILFDATTHARLLPGTNHLNHYDTWELWGDAGVGLDSDQRRLQHIERVHGRQAELGVQFLTPTETLDSPVGPSARNVLETARTGRGLHAGTWQSLAAKRSFWSAGSDLDAFVGQLAHLRAPGWVLTVVNDAVNDFLPNMSDTSAFEGLFRTIHSLSQRSVVIVANADFAGVPACAAGATHIGTGWDRPMKAFDPAAFITTAPAIRIPASYVTQGGLSATLKRSAAEAIERLGPAVGEAFRGGPMPIDDSAQRVHHLARLRELIEAAIAPAQRVERVRVVQQHFEGAKLGFDWLIGAVPGEVSVVHRTAWIDEPLVALQQYATAEGLWLP